MGSKVYGRRIMQSATIVGLCATSCQTATTDWCTPDGLIVNVSNSSQLRIVADELARLIENKLARSTENIPFTCPVTSSEIENIPFTCQVTSSELDLLGTSLAQLYTAFGRGYSSSAVEITRRLMELAQERCPNPLSSLQYLLGRTAQLCHRMDSDGDLVIFPNQVAVLTTKESLLPTNRDISEAIGVIGQPRMTDALTSNNGRKRETAIRRMVRALRIVRVALGGTQIDANQMMGLKGLQARFIKLNREYCAAQRQPSLANGLRIFCLRLAIGKTVRQVRQITRHLRSGV